MSNATSIWCGYRLLVRGYCDMSGVYIMVDYLALCW